MTKTFAGVLALTAVLGLAVGAGAGYVTTGRATAGATPQPVAAAAAQSPAQVGAPGKPGGNNNATIEKVDGTTATVKTGNGSVDVQLANATLQKQEKVAQTDLKVGDNVFGRGEPNAEGVVALNNLQIVANLPGRGGQGGGNAVVKPGGGGPQGGGQGNQRGFVVGSIAKIDGKTLTINPPNGSAVTATLAEGVQIERIAPAQPADLKTGQTVALQRPPGGNGTTILTIVSG
jgi:hypothetical protein